MKIWQWAIVKRNADTWVTWRETKAEALAEFAATGHHDAWRIVRMPHFFVVDPPPG